MPNMSYCQFRNTLTDLEDCLEAMENMDMAAETDENGEPISYEEIRAMKKLIGVADVISSEYGEDREDY